ncbi:MAG: hypothetical protein U9N79_01035 [Actinomycetota bacterium]|nr:hypothetical protein [Actinomycetota bacterium]
MAGKNSTGAGTGRRLFSVLLFISGTAATLGTVFGFFGATWWGFDRLADLRFPYVVILVTAAIIYGFVFRRALSSLFLLAAVANAVLLAPMWLATQTVAVSNDGIRIISLDTGESSDHHREIVEWIGQEHADIALLHNASGDWEGALNDSGVPYRIIATPVAAGATGRSLVLVHRDATVSPLPPAPGADLTVRVETEIGMVTVIGMAVRNPDSTSAADDRARRFATVNAAALQMEGPVVVTGNLETSRWSHAFDLLAEGMTNSEDGFGYAATWPSYDWPFVGNYTGLPVDHAVYIGAITVPYRSVGPDLGPVHRPLLFDVSHTG